MKAWNVSNNNYVLTDLTSNVKTLETAVYHLKESDKIGLYLTRFGDKFPIPKKIYGNDQELVTRILKSYNTLNQNQGILLTGHKGSGKTVTANMISNQASRPVILITNAHPYQDLPGFLASIEQEVVILIDEYDKIFEKSDALLSIMDGVFNSEHKKLFILTKNDGHISQFLIDRPGRIRYLKEYSNLSKELVKEIIDDLLEERQYRDELLDALMRVEILTVDIVKSILVEMNMHKLAPMKAIEYFNVRLKTNLVDIMEIVDGKEVSLYNRVTIMDLEAGASQLGKLLNREFNVDPSPEEEYDELGRVLTVQGNLVTVGSYDVWREKALGNDISNAKIRTFKVTAAQDFRGFFLA